MTDDEARTLLGDVPQPGATWADLGAGTGTFTRALAGLLGPKGAVWAVDRTGHAVRALSRLDLRAGATVHAVHADFADALDLPTLDGILMANALHFVPEPEALLGRLTRHLGRGGRFLLIEYDQVHGNPWVPYPIPPSRFRELAHAVGLSEPREVGRRRSSFGREMYAAVASWGRADA